MVDFRISDENVFTSTVKHINTNKGTIGNIYGYFDTACSYTSICLYSLASLLGLDSNVIAQYVRDRISKGYPVYYSNVANGDIVTTVPISVINCNIGKYKFKNLYCMLNINDKLCESNGIFRTSNNAVIRISEHMLLGLDFIRSHDSVYFGRDLIQVDKFNISIYERFWNAPQDIIKLYSSINIPSLYHSLKLQDTLPEIDDLW